MMHAIDQEQTALRVQPIDAVLTTLRIPMIDNILSTLWTPTSDAIQPTPRTQTIDEMLTTLRTQAVDTAARRHPPQIAVIGVGGAGINAAMRLRDVGLPGLRFIAVDTSAQTLARAGGVTQILLDGPTGGLGTGGHAALGRAAAEAGAKRLTEALAGLDLGCVVAGLAGGTGGGAAPVVAGLARAAGAVTVGFGITPFAFEASHRAAAADLASAALASACDTSVTLDNRRAQALAGGRVTLDVALRVADDVIRQAVQGLGEMVGGKGWITVDWPLIRSLLGSGGAGCLALGLGRGASPARAAMQAALASPLADMRALDRARGVLAHVSGGPDLALCDAADALGELQARLRPDCRLVVGAGCDPRLAGTAQVMLLGTGLPAVARTLTASRPAAHRVTALHPAAAARRPNHTPALLARRAS
jgi:cell division protein FtsZ